MALQTDNKYEYKGNKEYNDYGNYYGRDRKYRFANNFYNPKAGDGTKFKNLEKGKNFDKTEEFYNRNQNYQYKKEGAEGNDGSKLMFTNSKKMNNETEEAKEGEVKEDTPKFMFTNSKKKSEGDNFKEIDQKGDVSFLFYLFLF